MLGHLFSGQGSQKPGMAEGLCRSSRAAAELIDRASTHTGVDLRGLSEEMLTHTTNAQLAIVCTSMAAWTAWRERTEAGGCFAGFSLGEYSALAASGILDLEPLLDLVKKRSELMHEASSKYPGAMYAILGPDAATIEHILDGAEYAGQVFAVNYNCPGQTVISGLQGPAAAAAEALKAAGAKRCVRLNVAGAFHTHFMSEAAESLKTYAKSLTFNAPTGIVYSNVLAKALAVDTDWPNYLASHLCRPVRWTQEINRMLQDGCSGFREMGHGKVLTGLVKKIRRDLDVRPIEDAATLEAALAETPEV